MIGKHRRSCKNLFNSIISRQEPIGIHKGRKGSLRLQVSPPEVLDSPYLTNLRRSNKTLRNELSKSCEYGSILSEDVKKMKDGLELIKEEKENLELALSEEKRKKNHLRIELEEAIRENESLKREKENDKHVIDKLMKTNKKLRYKGRKSKRKYMECIEMRKGIEKKKELLKERLVRVLSQKDVLKQRVKSQKDLKNGKVIKLVKEQNLRRAFSYVKLLHRSTSSENGIVPLLKIKIPVKSKMRFIKKLQTMKNQLKELKLLVSNLKGDSSTQIEGFDSVFRVEEMKINKRVELMRAQEQMKTIVNFGLLDMYV